MYFILTKFKINNLVSPVIRFCHSYNESSGVPVRVRFAPSPTGFLHLGGLRTALYNYLFAKANKGSFILRIEDTDRTRFVQGATEKIIADLQWGGINIDEGPNVGGKYEPYFQSKRLELYRSEVRKLLENGTAYYCFCTERRLDLVKKEAVRTRQIPKYDNKCRHLTPVQIAEKLANNAPFCIRFKLNQYNKPVKDLVYGNIYYNVAENEGDPIIIKSDGFPTYHLACVVDDHHMNITHVLRGVEWQISTTKHLLIFKAFGWTPPQYGHLPLLINSDGSKLSKRQGDIQINYYKDRGIFPLALLNYITQAGGGFNRQQSLKPQLHSMDELIQMFDISRINLSPSRLNPDLLREFNRLELQKRISNEETCTYLLEDVMNLVQRTFLKEKQNLDIDPNHVKNILQWASNRIASIHDLVEGNLSFLWILPKTKVQLDLERDVVTDLMAILEGSTFQKADINLLLKNFTRANNLKFSSFMKTLRAALSGLDEGPGVAEMMEILGKDVTLKRIGNIKCK